MHVCSLLFSLSLSLYTQIRQSLDGLLTQMKNFPARLKTYASFEYVQRMLRNYLKVNVTITSLKSEALKVSHVTCSHVISCMSHVIYCIMSCDLLGKTLEAVNKEVRCVMDII